MISLFKNFNLVLSVSSTASPSVALVTLDSLTGVVLPGPSATCLEKAPALRRIPFDGPCGLVLKLGPLLSRPKVCLGPRARGFCSLFYLTRICLSLLTLSFFWRYNTRKSFLKFVYARAQPASPLVKAFMMPLKSPSAIFPAPSSLLAQLVILGATPVSLGWLGLFCTAQDSPFALG